MRRLRTENTKFRVRFEALEIPVAGHPRAVCLSHKDPPEVSEWLYSSVMTLLLSTTILGKG